MKTLAAAFAIVILASFASYAVLRLFDRDAIFSAAVASLILGSLPFVHQALEAREAGPVGAQGSRPIRLQPFEIRWQFVLAYGAAALYTTTVLAALILAALIGLGSQEEGLGSLRFPVTSVAIVVVLMFPFVPMAVSYVLGSWVGTRCDKHGTLVTILMVYLGIAFAAATFYLLDPVSSFDEEIENELLARFVWMFELTFFGLVAVVFSTAAAQVGRWRGRQLRQARYVGHLLRALPADTREALLQLVYEEAQRGVSQPPTAAAQTTSHAPSPP